jgi:hypothetical protein
LPALGAGYLLAQGHELAIVARAFGTGVMLLALLPLLLPVRTKAGA